jgi:hypothetical protein
MYRRLKAIADTYVTDKIIRQKRHKTANVGLAGTIDLFKLFNIANSGSAPDVTELSRALIKFDLSELHALTGSTLDYADSSFQCILSMRDVYGGQTVPSNFTLELFPLSRSFDEGIGRDVVYYNDIDSANFVTSSFVGAPTLWSEEGANKGGLLGSDNIDYITSGNLGEGIVSLSAKQTFTNGTEDLSIDVTSLISASLAGQIPDHGFRLAFTSSQEDDQFTYFVKRFSSRHAYNENMQPRLIVKYNDTLQSNENDFFFDISGSLSLFNYNRTGLTHLQSASTDITGNDSLMLRLVATGSGELLTKYVTASQQSIGSNFITGAYLASFILRSTDSDYVPLIVASGSVDFYPYWESLDGTVSFLTGSSFAVSQQPRTTAVNSPRNLTVNITNMKPEYQVDEKVRMRIFVQDNTAPIVASKLPLESKSMIFTNMYYSIRDTQSNEVIVPFETNKNATLLSTDSQGMYFDLYMSDLVAGRSYRVDLLIKDNDTDHVFKNIGKKFKVDNQQGS